MKHTRATAVGLIAVLAALASAPIADARFLPCRSDPTVLLSDGTVLDLSADIDTDLWDVATISYTIHIPSGLKALLVVRTPNWPTTKERFSIVADQARGVYDTETTVTTGTKGVDVTANLLIKSMILYLGTAAQSGQDGQPLRVGLRTR